MPPAVARLRAEFPGVQLDLKLVDPDPLPEVERGAADLAIVFRQDPVPPSPAVRLVHLQDDPMRAVLPGGTGWRRSG